MAYIGNTPAEKYSAFQKQDFTTSATTSYTLDHPVANQNELALFINFVRQEPTAAYTASGTSLTLTSATTSSDDMYCVFLGKAVQTVNPPSGSVGASQLASDAVTSSKLNDDIISGQTALASEPADTDEFLISDAGTLKRIDYSLIKGGGGFTLLSTTSIGSAVGYVTIGSSTLFSSTYDQYIIRGNMRPASNGAHGYARVRTSGGAQTSNYKFNRMWQYSGSGTVSTDNSGGAPQLNFVLGQSVNDNSGTTFEIFLSKPNTTDNYKSISFRTVNMDSSPDFAHHVSGGAWVGGTDALTGLDLYFSSGNIDTGGVITLHGVNKS